MFLSLEESILLVDILTKNLDNAGLLEKKTQLAKIIDRTKLEDGFSISENEFIAISDLIEWEHFTTRLEREFCLESLLEIPGRWWEEYGYPKNHSLEKFCSCRLCFYFYRNLDERLVRTDILPGSLFCITKDNKGLFFEYKIGNHRVSALGRLEEYNGEEEKTPSSNKPREPKKIKGDDEVLGRDSQAKKRRRSNPKASAKKV